MKEYAEKYSVSPSSIPLESLPTILNRNLKSDESPASDHNRSVVRQFLDQSDLEKPQANYVYAIYLMLTFSAKDIGHARGLLRQKDDILFQDGQDREVDIKILHTLLNSGQWGNNVTTPWHRDNNKA